MITFPFVVSEAEAGLASGVGQSRQSPVVLVTSTVEDDLLDDTARRKELYERLLYALQNYEDPWNAAVQKPAVRREYEKLEA